MYILFRSYQIVAETSAVTVRQNCASVRLEALCCEFSRVQRVSEGRGNSGLTAGYFMMNSFTISTPHQVSFG